VDDTPPKQLQCQTRRSARLQSASRKASAKKIEKDGRSHPIAKVAKPKDDPIIKKSFECPSNVYLTSGHKCPTRFEDIEAVRTHCLKYHRQLPNGERLCQFTDDVKLDGDACRDPGCGWYFNIRDKGRFNWAWRPGMNRVVLTTKQPVPSWVKQVATFVYPSGSSNTTLVAWEDEPLLH
jgi:hypothetical protein